MRETRKTRPPAAARRAERIQMPIIPTVADWIAGTPGTISLGQGVVHYGPPPAALSKIPAFLADAAHHKYVPDAGIPRLRKTFEEKLRTENGIDAPGGRRIFVTAGANQGFLNVLLCLCDPGDEVILLSPYYFNHEMAVGLADCRAVCVPTDRNHQPRLAAIEAAITARTRAVVTVSPNNPAGVVYSPDALREINRLSTARGIYHISDEAYEYFTYDGATHFSPGSLDAEQTISLFSMSKSYGMASWRVGFLVVPEHLFDDMMKIQDTVVICAPAVSQAVALEALSEGRRYCRLRLPALARVRELERRRRHERKPRVRRNRIERLPHVVRLRPGRARQELRRPREIELRQIGIEQKPDVKRLRHGEPPMPGPLAITEPSWQK